jgi:hypothetical protein
MRHMDLANSPFNGISNNKTQESPSGDVNAASNINEEMVKDGQKDDQDPLEQFYKTCIFFTKETLQDMIATQDAQEAKAMAEKFGASLPDHAARTIRRVEPDY